jgi:hypothetical protein
MTEVGLTYIQKKTVVQALFTRSSAVKALLTKGKSRAVVCTIREDGLSRQGILYITL